MLADKMRQPLATICIERRPAGWIDLSERPEQHIAVFGRRDSLFETAGTFPPLIFLPPPTVDLFLLLRRYRAPQHVRCYARSERAHGSNETL